MQKLSVLKYWPSETQRFFSTSSRCMIAICPAGPPKLIKPSFTQNQKASQNPTDFGSADLSLSSVVFVSIQSPPFQGTIEVMKCNHGYSKRQDRRRSSPYSRMADKTPSRKLGFRHYPVLGNPAAASNKGFSDVQRCT